VKTTLKTPVSPNEAAAPATNVPPSEGGHVSGLPSLRAGGDACATVKTTLKTPVSANETAAPATNVPPSEGGHVSGLLYSKASGDACATLAKPWRLWSGACFAILLLAVFAHPLLTLMKYAAGSTLFSYILLVPLVSAYLLYLRRDQLPKDYTAKFPLAILSLGIGLGALGLTYWLNIGRQGLTESSYLALVTVSFLCCLAAGGFFFLGREWMRAAAFPLTYLIFMVPIPDALTQALETASKYASAEVANVLFHLSGTPFLRDSLVFQLPNITIQVAQECSGIRSSVVLLMTSILAANLFLQTPWRRFVLVVLVIPLAILRNGFRILVIGLLCVNVGPQIINSLIHRRGGPVFFVLSLIPFLLVLLLLRKGDVHTRQAK
jgi:exosortase C (VPDSG-CTERM-specific)